jgi:ribosome-associated protein
MDDRDAIRLSPNVAVPLTELTFLASRAGGPGGQHVNRSSTRIELWWDVARSPSLTEADRVHLLARLAGRLTTDGALRLVAADSRSQGQNRAAAIERFRRLVTEALHRPKPRRKTRPTRASRAARLESKRRQSTRKRERRPPGMEE